MVKRDARPEACRGEMRRNKAAKETRHGNKAYRAEEGGRNEMKRRQGAEKSKQKRE